MRAKKRHGQPGQLSPTCQGVRSARPKGWETRFPERVMKMVKRILVADDNPSMLDILDCFLTREGYLVDTAPGVFEALAAMASNEYQIMLLDKNMPGSEGERDGGIELLRRVHSMPLRSRVIMMTGSPTVGSLAELFSLGAQDLVYKPFSLLELGQRIKRALLQPDAANRADFCAG